MKPKGTFGNSIFAVLPPPTAVTASGSKTPEINSGNKALVAQVALAIVNMQGWPVEEAAIAGSSNNHNRP